MQIWCNVQLSPAELSRLRNSVAPHTLLVPPPRKATALEASGPDPLLNDADIAFGQPSPEQLFQLPRLQWCEISSAGYGRYDTAALREHLVQQNTAFSNASSVFADPCAQHVLAMMLALGRCLLPSYDDQRGSHHWEYTDRRFHSRLLTGQSVLMLGYGAIGRRLTELLTPFRMSLTAVRRRSYSEPGVRIVAEESLTAVLPQADHVVNLLPENDSTYKFVNARRLSCCKPGARFYNVGRGATVDQKALREALLSGRLGAAYLDVTEVEPLPVDDPLWETPNCFITPHTAGGRHDQDAALVDHFLENLKAFEARRDLAVDRVW